VKVLGVREEGCGCKMWNASKNLSFYRVLPASSGIGKRFRKNATTAVYAFYGYTNLKTCIRTTECYMF
jgi:hypothetical protein